EPDHVDQVADALVTLGGGNLEQAAVELKRLLGVEELVQIRLLGKVADPLVLGHVGGGLVEDEGIAFGRKEQPQKQLDGGGLARAVRAQQPENLAAVHLKIEGLESLNLR